MKLLVVEQNEKISNIYKKIFNEKRYEVDFVKNEFECLDKFNKNYDCVVLEKSSTSFEDAIEVKLRKTNSDQKIFFLSPYLNSNEESPKLMRETREIIEKPFAMIALISQLELKQQKS